MSKINLNVIGQKLSQNEMKMVSGGLSSAGVDNLIVGNLTKEALSTANLVTYSCYRRKGNTTETVVLTGSYETLNAWAGFWTSAGWNAGCSMPVAPVPVEPSGPVIC
jgi:hypothetical protein